MNIGTYKRIARCGFQEAADHYKGEVRTRLRREGLTRRDASLGADMEVERLFIPLVEQAEKAKALAKAGKQEINELPPRLPGIPSNIDSILDPNYSEPNQGKQLRDGLVWAAMEWMRVIAYNDSGPACFLDLALVPPPNAFALFVLSSYALDGKHCELIARALAFATKTPDEKPTTDRAETAEEPGFLDEIT